MRRLCHACWRVLIMTIEKAMISTGQLTINHDNKTASFSPVNTCLHVSRDYEQSIKDMKAFKAIEKRNERLKQMENDKYTNHVKAHNELAKVFNGAVPELVAYTNDVGLERKKDKTLTKKTTDAINVILAKHKSGKVQAWVNTCYGTSRVHFKISFTKSSYEDCYHSSYIENGFYFENKNPELMKKVTVKQLESAERKLKAVHDKQIELRTQESQLKRLLNR